MFLNSQDSVKYMVLWLPKQQNTIINDVLWLLKGILRTLGGLQGALLAALGALLAALGTGRSWRPLGRSREAQEAPEGSKLVLGGIKRHPRRPHEQ